jgi:hypothetical protein
MDLKEDLRPAKPPHGAQDAGAQQCGEWNESGMYMDHLNALAGAPQADCIGDGAAQVRYREAAGIGHFVARHIQKPHVMASVEVAGGEPIQECSNAAAVRGAFAHEEDLCQISYLNIQTVCTLANYLV